MGCTQNGESIIKRNPTPRSRTVHSEPSSSKDKSEEEQVDLDKIITASLEGMATVLHDLSQSHLGTSHHLFQLVDWLVKMAPSQPVDVDAPPGVTFPSGIGEARWDNWLSARTKVPSGARDILSSGWDM
ncbi:3943_t:CDS:2, partial [Acaulospora colombiana]